MKHSVPHDLSLDLARKATDAALQAYRARFPEYDPQVKWTSERTAEVTFRALGKTLTGTFEILDRRYVFVVDDKEVAHQREIAVAREL